MKINTVAAIKRIPIGTKLLLVNCLTGPQLASKRVVKQIRSKDVVVTIDDPEHKNYNRDSYMSLDNVKVESTSNGFKLLDKETNELLSEYVFEEVQS